MVLLSLLRWMKAHTACSLVLVLSRSGPLLEEFVALCPTLVMEWDLKFGGRSWKRLDQIFPIERWRRRATLNHFLQNRSFDVVYANTIMNGDLLSLLSSKRLPTVTHIHEMEYWLWRGGPKNLGTVKTYTDQYIAASAAVRNNLIAKHDISPDKISIVQEFIAEPPRPATSSARDEVRAKLGILKDAFVIGASGAEFWRKGRDLVVHLLLALQKLDLPVPVELLWVGRPGDKDEEYGLEFDLERAGVRHLFKSTGEVGNPDSFFAAFDVFALLSRDDPFPLVCLEAAAKEIPILCFAGAGGMPELVEEDAGFVVPYLDTAFMAAKIALLVRDCSLRRHLGARAREKVLSKNVTEIAAPKIFAEIKTLLHKRDSKEAV